MKNQKGFTLVEGLLIALVVGIVSIGGYYVWSQNQNDVEITNYQQCVDASNPIMESNPPMCSADGNTYTGSTIQPDSDSEESVKTQEDISNTPEGWKIYKNEDYGISFAHPSDWVITDNKTVTDLISLTLTSSDFVELEGAYGGTVQGIRVYVAVTNLDSEYISTNEQIVAGSARKPAIYTEVMDIETNGIRGISYIVGYEGPRSYTYSYENSGKVYRVTLEEISSSTESTFHPDIDIFEQLIKTLQLD